MLATARLLVAVAVLFGSVVRADRIPDPFGGDTMAVANGILVWRWGVVTAQIEYDKAIVESCLTGGSDECAPALQLLAVVREARQQQGLAVIGHINRAINAMIKPTPGAWLGPLDALKLGNGDCKAYAIAKYFALNEAGIARVRIVIVHNKSRAEDHMVVAIYFEGRWLILDNDTLMMVEDRQQTRYTPLFVLDHHGVREYRTVSSPSA